MKNQSAHSLLICHIVSIKVGKQGLDIFKLDKSCIYPLTPKLCLMTKSSMKIKWFWVSNMEISKTSQKLHFRVTKKDTGFPFHFHVLYLFKSWSNLGFEQDSNVHQNSKKIRKMKNQST